jgi:ribulose-5-phosphate 4-epimerase/fuculose-1-phosphate aldolase
MSDPVTTARRDLAAAHRVCVRNGFHEAIDNHLSFRVPGSDDEMLLTPFPLHWSEVSASTLQRVSLADGTLLDGAGELEATAWSIHGALQRNHPRHRCFMHTHMPYATAIACRDHGRLEPIHQHLIGLHADIAYFDDYTGEAVEPHHGEEISAAMGDRSILFLANHGVVTAGGDPAHAFERMYYLERACQFQILAESGGRALRTIDKSILAAPNRREDRASWGHADKHFGAWLRILAREEPDFSS